MKRNEPKYMPVPAPGTIQVEEPRPGASPVVADEGPGGCGLRRRSGVVTDARGNVFEMREAPKVPPGLATLNSAVSALAAEVASLKERVIALDTMLGLRRTQTANVAEPIYAVPIPYFD